MTEANNLIELKQRLKTITAPSTGLYEEKLHAMFTEEEIRFLALDDATERLAAAELIDPATLSEEELERHEFNISILQAIIENNQPVVETHSGDRALDFAKFIVEESDGLGDDLMAVTIGKFGDLNREQYERGMAIAEELLNARAAEYRAEADACRVELARRDALGIE